MWYQDSFLLDPTDRRSMDSRGDKHMLTIRNVQSSDFGNYRYFLMKNEIAIENLFKETLNRYQIETLILQHMTIAIFLLTRRRDDCLKILMHAQFREKISCIPKQYIQHGIEVN